MNYKLIFKDWNRGTILDGCTIYKFINKININYYFTLLCVFEVNLNSIKYNNIFLFRIFVND